MKPLCYWITILSFFAAGCGAKDSDSGPSGPDLPHFDDITSAPAAIQTAARAVVRVRTIDAYGTGSFISPDGLLLTNNHVLGATVCPIEGCSIQLAFMRERGAPVQPLKTVFAVPVAIDVGLDMAVVQLYSTARDTSGGKLSTPDYLHFGEHDAPSLLGTHVNVVGHPEGHLKKWTEGIVDDALGSWFSMTAFTLPGNSGSPVLDDAGNIVGLLHRGATGQDLITSDGVVVSSIGTASSALKAAMGASLPDVMISVDAMATKDQIVANDLVYLAADRPTPDVDLQATSVLSLLGSACDSALAKVSYASPDELSQALTPCYDAMSWIECRTDESPPFHFITCPASEDKAAWSMRFQSVSQRWVEMNGQPDLYASSFANAALASSHAEGLQNGDQSLQQALTSSGRALDFTVANYLAAFEVAEYQGQNIVEYVRGYATAPQYQVFASSIASTVGWLYANRALSQSDASDLMNRLLEDPNTDLAAKLSIEEYEYGSGWIQ